MLGIIAFFLLLTVFSLAAQLVGYISYVQAKRRKKDPPGGGWNWPTPPEKESKDVLPADSLPKTRRQATSDLPAPPALHNRVSCAPIFSLDLETPFAVNVPCTLALMHSTRGEELLP